jgi:hypothetical protein
MISVPTLSLILGSRLHSSPESAQFGLAGLEYHHTSGSPANCSASSGKRADSTAGGWPTSPVVASSSVISLQRQ